MAKDMSVKVPWEVSPSSCTEGHRSHLQTGGSKCESEIHHTKDGGAGRQKDPGSRGTSQSS